MLRPSVNPVVCSIVGKHCWRQGSFPPGLWLWDHAAGSRLRLGLSVGLTGLARPDPFERRRRLAEGKGGTSGTSAGGVTRGGSDCARGRGCRQEGISWRQKATSLRLSVRDQPFSRMRVCTGCQTERSADKISTGTDREASRQTGQQAHGEGSDRSSGVSPASEQSATNTKRPADGGLSGFARRNPGSRARKILAVGTRTPRIMPRQSVRLSGTQMPRNPDSVTSVMSLFQGRQEFQRGHGIRSQKLGEESTLPRA